MNLLLKYRFFLVVLVLFSVNSFAQKLAVKNQTVEYQYNPIGLDSAVPRFSWTLSTSLKNTLQSSYELRVGTDSVKLKAGKEMFWTSGTRQTDQSVLVNYGGPALQSDTRYFWQVRVRDNHGNTSAWSAVHFWQMGLKAADWTSEWITVEGKDTSKASPYFRKDIQITKPIRRATAYLTANGLYEAHINGSRVGDHYFAPGWTSYKNRLQYQAYDLSALLKKGNNAIGIVLGDGWYKGRIGFDGQHDYYGDQRAFLMQIVVEYTDGSKETLRTDKGWKYQYGAILSSGIYDGEVYDSRRVLKGWLDGRVFKHDAVPLLGTVSPPVKKHEQFKAIRVFKTPKGETVADFGQNLVGWEQIKASGPAGTRITISHAEVLDKAGNFYTQNLRSAKSQNTYVLNGEGTQVFEPHFTYHGFRYIKIEGYPGVLEPSALTAIALYSDMKQNGTFVTSDTLLNKLQRNILWGQKGNFLDVPTDCPQRDERLGWTGDAQAFFSTAAYNMDVAGFFTKWLKDLAADQYADGSVPHVIPNVLGSGQGGATGWADASTIIPWGMYENYGDKRILEEQYASMKAWEAYMIAQSKNDLWDAGFHFGDWLFYRPNDDTEGRSAVTDKYLIAQTFFAHSTQLLINTAKVLGKKEDVEVYTALLAKIKAAFQREYMTSTGRLVSGTQTAYVLALHFDMLPEALRAQAAERLVKNVESYGNHLTTGFLGTPYLCQVLSRFGYTDVAYKLLFQESYPSWLYPVKMGATTIWERWDGIKEDGTFQNDGMNSFNHYAYGAIGEWMYNHIAGIKLSAPGYKQLTIAPEPGGKLTSAKGTLMTPYGLVKSEWKIENGKILLDISIPANTTASLLLPKAAQKEVKENGLSLKTEASNAAGKDVQLSRGSGDYHFEYGF
jgi:alpha-L-rhamnosidase